jgi:hypothetical protein
MDYANLPLSPAWQQITGIGQFGGRHQGLASGTGIADKTPQAVWNSPMPILAHNETVKPHKFIALYAISKDLSRLSLAKGRRAGPASVGGKTTVQRTQSTK